MGGGKRSAQPANRKEPLPRGKVTGKVRKKRKSIKHAEREAVRVMQLLMP